MLPTLNPGETPPPPGGVSVKLYTLRRTSGSQNLQVGTPMYDPPFGSDLGQIKGGHTLFRISIFPDPQNFRLRRLNFALQIATKGAQKQKIACGGSILPCKTLHFFACGGLSSLTPPLLVRRRRRFFCNVYSIYCDFAFENTLLEAAAGENFDAYELA